MASECSAKGDPQGFDLDGQRLALLPLTPGARQTIIAEAPWLALATTLVRAL